jgi:hypothetical protein
VLPGRIISLECKSSTDTSCVTGLPARTLFVPSFFAPHPTLHPIWAYYYYFDLGLWL